MKKCLLPALLFLLATGAGAQDSAFALKSYKYRTPGFRALTVNFYMNSAFSNLKSEENKGNTSSFHLAPSHVGYLRFRSTDRRWHESALSIASGFSRNRQFSNLTIEKIDIKSSSSAASGFWSVTERYFRRNNWYWEFGVAGSGSIQGNRYTDTARTIRHQQPEIQSHVKLGFGRGRIEPVQDAQMALFILNDLQQQGLLQRSPDAETTLGLARIITDINNRRIFDSRRRRVYELTRLHNFLQQSGLIGQADINVFTTINDNWALAFNPVRFAGTTWYLHMRPGGSLLRNHQTETRAGAKFLSEHRNTIHYLSPEAGFRRHVPVSLQWQRNMGASVVHTRSENTAWKKINTNAGNSEEEKTTSASGWSTFLFYNVGYFPNNRTLVNAGVAFQGSINNPKGIANNIKQERMVQPSANLSADYFISYNTRISLNAGAFYRQVHYERYNAKPITTRILQGEFSLAVAHVIF